MRQRRDMIEHVPHKPKTRNNDYPTTILYADNKKTNIKTKRDESRPYGSRPKIGPFLGSKKAFIRHEKTVQTARLFCVRIFLVANKPSISHFVKNRQIADSQPLARNDPFSCVKNTPKYRKKPPKSSPFTV